MKLKNVSDMAKLYLVDSLFKIIFAAMNKKYAYKNLFATIGPVSFLVVFFSIIGCTNSRKAIYFNNLSDTTFTSAFVENQLVIQKNDLISISVSSLNPDASMVFNTPNLPTVTTTTANGSTTQMTGYLVNSEGVIQFPVLGTIRATGLTKKQLSDTLVKKLVTKKLLVDPIVSIRFLNFRVTVMGEVARPTVITVANERISLLEAIGLAGDLTIYAKRDNVLLIREENGEKIIRRINLNSNEIFTSEFYYLKPNDIIYAEPNNAKITASSNTRQILPIVLSALSFVAIILTRVF